MVAKANKSDEESFQLLYQIYISNHYMVSSPQEAELTLKYYESR